MIWKLCKCCMSWKGPRSMAKSSAYLLSSKLGFGIYPEESHSVVCHLLDVENITRHERLRPFPGQAFSHTLQRLPPVNSVHIVPVQHIRPCGNFVKRGLRNLFAGFIRFKAVNQVSNQRSSISCCQQQNLLPQLFQSHGNYLFEQSACLSQINQTNLLPKALHGGNL